MTVRERIERVRAASDIAEVIGQTIALKRVGRNWWGLCPFHKERTPSFSVDADRGVYHCFGCGAGGDLFRFVQETEGVGFRKAVEVLASRMGMSVGPSPATSPHLQRSAPPPPSRPPQDEVSSALEGCTSVDQDVEVMRWLQSRGIDPWTVADRDLAHALPATAAVPRWARLNGRTWTSAGYRVLVPLYDWTGKLVSVHARAVRKEIEPKAALPARHESRGLMLADALARHMLATRELAGELWIVEGVPDYLLTAASWGDAADPGPAVLGLIGGGSWNGDISARVPDGARVVVATHGDLAGDVYAAAIRDSLAGRVALERWRSPEAA